MTGLGLGALFAQTLEAGLTPHREGLIRVERTLEVRRGIMSSGDLVDEREMFDVSGVASHVAFGVVLTQINLTCSTLVTRQHLLILGTLFTFPLRR